MDADDAVCNFIADIRGGACVDWVIATVISYARKHSGGHPATGDLYGAAEWAVTNNVTLAQIIDSRK